jgi:hypothetical protein
MSICPDQYFTLINRVYASPRNLVGRRAGVRMTLTTLAVE